DPNVVDKIRSSPRAREFEGWTPPQPSIEELRKPFGNVSDDELILRLLVPEKEIEAMRAAPVARTEYVLRSKNPERALVERLIREAKGGYLHFETEGLSVTLSRGDA